MCGVSWGVFQVTMPARGSSALSLLAPKIGPRLTVHLLPADAVDNLCIRSRPYCSSAVRYRLCVYVLGRRDSLSSGVVRAVAGIEGDLGWRLPFVLQWVWPIPLLIGAYLAPESPWNSIRRGNVEEARKSLARLREDSPEKEREIESTLAYIQHTTALEKAETENASFLECFQGTNLRRTEIVSVPLAAIRTQFSSARRLS